MKRSSRTKHAAKCQLLLNQLQHKIYCFSVQLFLYRVIRTTSVQSTDRLFFHFFAYPSTYILTKTNRSSVSNAACQLSQREEKHIYIPRSTGKATIAEAPSYAAWRLLPSLCSRGALRSYSADAVAVSWQSKTLKKYWSAIRFQQQRFLAVTSHST